MGLIISNLKRDIKDSKEAENETSKVCIKTH